MKKYLPLFLIVASAIFSACTKEEQEPTEQNVWLMGYKAYDPDDTYDKVASTFLFFKADDNITFDVKGYTFKGSYPDYEKIKDETWDLLQNNKIKTTDEKIINADYSISAGITEDSQLATLAKIKTGRYFMVAIFNYSLSSSLAFYKKKYACQYIDIEYDKAASMYTVVFPCDAHHYGKIEWVSSSQVPYPYDFNNDWAFSIPGQQD